MKKNYKKYILLAVAAIIIVQGLFITNTRNIESQNYISGDVVVSSRTVSGRHQGCSDTGVTCYDGNCDGKWRGWSCSSGASGVWCVNHPQGMQGHLYYSYTVHDCTYVAEVLAWSQCVPHSFDTLNGTEYATDAEYVTVSGSSCTGVPVTRDCTMEPTPGECGTSHREFSPVPPTGIEQCRAGEPKPLTTNGAGESVSNTTNSAGEPMPVTTNDDGTYSWWCNGAWGSDVNVQCNTVPNPAIDGDVSCYVTPVQRYYDGSETLEFTAVLNFQPSPNYDRVDYLWGGDLLTGNRTNPQTSIVLSSVPDENYQVWVKVSHYGVDNYAYCPFTVDNPNCPPTDPDCPLPPPGITVSRIPLIEFNIPTRIADDYGACVAEWNIEYTGSGQQAPVECRIVNNFDQTEIDLGTISETQTERPNVRSGNSYKLECTSTITGIVVDTENLLICVDPNITEQ